MQICLMNRKLIICIKQIAMNISAQSAMTGRYFRRWWLFLQFCIRIILNIKLSTQALNYAMELSFFIESLLIFIQLIKIFQFFLCVFTWNRPSTTQKFKLRCFLPAWLVSIEIVPKAIVISVWYLPAEIFYTDAYSESTWTFKMVLFAKIINSV